jgi:hypothetical protein
MLMAKINFNPIDVLIVDYIGKNFSGDGMDPNVTGTYCTPYASGGPEVQKTVVLDLSEETHGNACGIGMADFTTRRVFKKIDFNALYLNALTSTVATCAKIPIILENDKEAIAAAIKTSNCIDTKNIRIVRIRNSAYIGDIYISEALLNEAKSNTNIEILEGPKEFEFDTNANLLRF